MLQRLLSQVVRGGSSAGTGRRRPTGRGYGRGRAPAGGGGSGARIGSMVERFIRGRR